VSASEIILSTRSHEAGVRRLLRNTGAVYGLVYALAFTLTIWGHDALVLNRVCAELRWAKLALGLPLVLLLGALCGRLAGAGGAGRWIAVWTGFGLVSGWLAGTAPFVGYNVATWIAEPRTRWLDLYPLGDAGLTRAVFLALVSAFAGTVGGLVGKLLMERLWDRSAGSGRVPLGSWAAILLCAPIAMLPGVAGDSIVNSDLRARQRVVYEVISTDPASGESHGNVDPYRGDFTANFTLHLVDYDLVAQDGVIDVVFDSGFAVRCTVFGRSLAGCPPVSTNLVLWTEALIEDALAGGQRAALLEHASRLTVDQRALERLASRESWLSERYELRKEAQRGGWILMSARFDTRYSAVCRYIGDRPVYLDSCVLEPPG
jgi:hypothetical protein